MKVFSKVGFPQKFFLAILGMLLLGGAFSFSMVPIELSVNYDSQAPFIPGPKKHPISIPDVSLEDHELTFEASHDDYTLELLDADGMVIYSTYVPSATTIVNLPAWLEGEYEIRLYGDTDYYFYGYIEL